VFCFWSFIMRPIHRSIRSAGLVAALLVMMGALAPQPARAQYFGYGYDYGFGSGFLIGSYDVYSALPAAGYGSLGALYGLDGIDLHGFAAVGDPYSWLSSDSSYGYGGQAIGYGGPVSGYGLAYPTLEEGQNAEGMQDRPVDRKAQVRAKAQANRRAGTGADRKGR
jgi:hypothetical protein